MGLRGEYDYLDGVVAGSTCDGARRLFDLWKHYIDVPFYHILTVPRKYTERAHALYYEEVLQFKNHLEEFLGLPVRINTDADPRSGAVTIRYRTLDQLDLICQRLTGGGI